MHVSSLDQKDVLKMAKDSVAQIELGRSFHQQEQSG